MSIKTNELRLGNYVFDDKNISMQIAKIETEKYTDWNSGNTINAILEKDGQYYESEIMNYIPITNDWLVKLGFQLYPSGYFCLNLKDKNTYLSIGAIHHRKINLVIEQDGNAFSTELSHINFIHEIQNVYFALTGDELVVSDAVS